MKKDFVTSIEQLNQSTVEAIKRFGEIQLRTLERLSEQQIEATSEYLGQGVRQLQVLAGSKDLQSMVDSQAKFMTELNESAVDHAKKTADIFNETKTEMTEWVEAGMKAAADNPFAKAMTTKAA